MFNLTVNIISAFLFVSMFIGSSFCQDLKSIASPGVIFEALALNHDLPTALRPNYSSPTDLVVSSDGKYLFVAEQTAKRIAVVDLTTNSVTKRIKLPNEVTGMALSNDDSKIYATCASELWPAGFVHEIDISAGRSIRKVATGHMSRSPVLSPDGNTLYVCNLFDNDISFIDVGSLSEIKRIKVIREPYSSAITPDGKTLIVGNSLPDEKATDSLIISSKISLINTQNTEDIVQIPLFKEGKVFATHSVFGIAVSNDGKYAFVTHLIGQINIPATRIDGGWIHLNNLSVINIKDKKYLNCFTLDHTSDQGAANPWDVAVTDDDSFICVAHAGSEDISIINFEELVNLANNNEFYQQNFSPLYSTSVRKLVPVKSKGPRALAIHENKLYTAGYFSEIVEEIDISLSTKKPSNSFNIVEAPPAMTSLRQGEYYFYSASLCFQNWQSCNSCHPFTRPDGMNWILNEIGGSQIPKNAKSMLYSWWTPPTNWTAKRPNAYESVRMGIKNELFRDPDENMAVCIDTFFMYLKHVPSPYLEKGILTPSAKRGKELYENKEKTDCTYCHPAPLFTLLNDKSKKQGFIDDPIESQIVIPYLYETWRTSPYDHLGSTTLEEIIENYPEGHTNVKNLSEKELNDLYEYFLSL